MNSSFPNMCHSDTLIESSSNIYFTYLKITKHKRTEQNEQLSSQQEYRLGTVSNKLLVGCGGEGFLLLAVPRRLFCFGLLVILDVVCLYLSLFLLYINIKIGKNRCLLLD